MRRMAAPGAGAGLRSSPPVSAEQRRRGQVTPAHAKTDAFVIPRSASERAAPCEMSLASRKRPSLAYEPGGHQEEEPEEDEPEEEPEEDEAWDDAASHVSSEQGEVSQGDIEEMAQRIRGGKLTMRRVLDWVENSRVVKRVRHGCNG